jgi:hypothetical protein
MERSKKNLLIVVLLVLGLFWGIEGRELKYLGDIEFSEEFYLNKVVVTDAGIFIRVEDDYAIIHSDLEGKILKRYARKGEGPGELKFLSDFAVGNDSVIAVGGRKLCRYKFSGTVAEEKKLKTLGFRVIAANDNAHYLGLKTVIREDKTAELFFHLYDANDGLVLEIPNEGLQRAVHPASGKKYPFPWFPSPFFNRPLLLPAKDGNVAIFMSRERSFQLLKEGMTVVKNSIDAPLEASPVTARDKEDFFAQIEPKPQKITKESVVFPETKELFEGVIGWEDGWALVRRGSLVILSYDGKYKEKIQWPSQIKDNETWETTRPEDFLYRFGEKLYVINDNESVSVFQLK